MEDRLTLSTLPAGFTETTVVTGLSRPTAMDFAPDGRLFVLEQSGDVKLVHSDGTTWTALQLSRLRGRAWAARHRLRPQVQLQPLRVSLLHQP